MSINVNTYFLLFRTISGLLRFDRREDNIDIVIQLEWFIFSLTLQSLNLLISFLKFEQNMSGLEDQKLGV